MLMLTDFQLLGHGSYISFFYDYVMHKEPSINYGHSLTPPLQLSKYFIDVPLICINNADG